jgi:hypothetical protein
VRLIAPATRAHASGAWLRCSVFSFNRWNSQSGSAHPTTLPAVKRYARTSRACYGFSAAECRRRNRETKRSNDRVGVPLCYWLSHCDSVGCRESTFQSRLKSRLEALPFSVLLFLVWLKASSLGSERHSFSLVADALLPIPLCSYCCRNFLLGPRLTYILSRQSELLRLQVADMGHFDPGQS